MLRRLRKQKASKHIYRKSTTLASFQCQRSKPLRNWIKNKVLVVQHVLLTIHWKQIGKSYLIDDSWLKAANEQRERMKGNKAYRTYVHAGETEGHTHTHKREWNTHKCSQRLDFIVKLFVSTLQSCQIPCACACTHTVQGVFKYTSE